MNPYAYDKVVHSLRRDHTFVDRYKRAATEEYDRRKRRIKRRKNKEVEDEQKELEGTEEKDIEESSSSFAGSSTGKGSQGSLLSRASSVDISLASPAGLDPSLIRTCSVDTSLGRVTKTSVVGNPSKSASTSNMETAGTVDTPITGISAVTPETSSVNKGRWMTKMMRKLLFWKSSESLPIEEAPAEQPCVKTMDIKIGEENVSVSTDQPADVETSPSVSKSKPSRTDSALSSNTIEESFFPSDTESMDEIRADCDSIENAVSPNSTIDGDAVLRSGSAHDKKDSPSPIIHTYTEPFSEGTPNDGIVAMPKTNAMKATDRRYTTATDREDSVLLTVETTLPCSSENGNSSLPSNLANDHMFHLNRNAIENTVMPNDDCTASPNTFGNENIDTTKDAKFSCPITGEEIIFPSSPVLEDDVLASSDVTEDAVLPSVVTNNNIVLPSSSSNVETLLLSTASSQSPITISNHDSTVFQSSVTDKETISSTDQPIDLETVNATLNDTDAKTSAAHTLLWEDNVWKQPIPDAEIPIRGGKVSNSLSKGQLNVTLLDTTLCYHCVTNLVTTLKCINA